MLVEVFMNHLSVKYTLAHIPSQTRPALGPKVVLIATSLAKAYYIICQVIIHLINYHEAHYIVIFNKLCGY